MLCEKKRTKKCTCFMVQNGMEAAGDTTIKHRGACVVCTLCPWCTLSIQASMPLVRPAHDQRHGCLCACTFQYLRLAILILKLNTQVK